MLQDYMIVDDSLPTSERLNDDDIIDDIISSRSTDSLDADDNADDNDTDRPETELPTSLTKAIDACAKLRNYFEQCDNSDDFLTSLGRMTDVLMKQDFKKRCARQTLPVFFREEILSDSFMYNLSEDETGYNKNNNFDHGHMFWVLKRTVSSKHFF